MSLENRSTSALFKRAEQLKRWEESETNREPLDGKDRPKKIQFSLECVFLAACIAGDKEEVGKLIEVGADVDTTNSDGLTALHQACIDDDLEMVEFLVKNGADVNRRDNEGWTPLHATASCGFISIANCFQTCWSSSDDGEAEFSETLYVDNGSFQGHNNFMQEEFSKSRFLIEQGADVAAVNHDRELPIDITESDEMEELLQSVIKQENIDVDEARRLEERVMLEDVQRWLNTGVFGDVPHPATRASALHVAASKGYHKIMHLLIQAGADINYQDIDGWTPLHAAAHWGQKEACEILVDNFCDMDKTNVVGQTAFEVTEGEMVRFLEDLRKKQEALKKDKSELNSLTNNKNVHSPKKKSSISKLSVNDKSSFVDDEEKSEKKSADESLVQDNILPKDKVPKVETKVEAEVKESKSTSDDDNDNKLRLNTEEKRKVTRPLPDAVTKVPITPVPQAPLKPETKEPENVHVPSWRKPVSFRNAIKIPFKYDDDNLWTSNPNASTNTNEKLVTNNNNNEEKVADVLLRRTQSFEADDKFYRRYCELKAKIESGNNIVEYVPSSNTTGSLPARLVSLKERYRKSLMHEDITLPSPTTHTTTASSAAANKTTTTSSAQDTATTTVTASTRNVPASFRSGVKNVANNVVEQSSFSAPTTPTASKLSPGNIFKNFFKSFVPPVRDEESETQRKAHAKRVRETRRSTQGVTLEEIKSAEQLVKKKQQQSQPVQLANCEPSSPVTDESSTKKEPTSISVSATITTGTSTVPQSSKSNNERRPSWRLRIDNGCKFMLEDARPTENENEVVTDGSKPSSEPADTATITLPLRKNKSFDDADLDKENIQDPLKISTQPNIIKRRRPKRRGTGSNFDSEEELDKFDPTVENNDVFLDESGVDDKSRRSSRVSSASSVGDEEKRPLTPSLNENGELDYKKLYKETLIENERLREKLKKSEDELTTCKSQLRDSAPNKSYLSEIEKREKRAMERKLSEMEEELKQLEQMKQENQRLRDENGALIRVISKLSK